MNYREKRCTNPSCRRVFAYVSGDISCPWCGEGSQRSWATFHFGVNRVPALKKGYYTVRLDRPAVNKKLKAIKALRVAWAMTGADPISLKDAKNIMDRVWNGQPYVLEGQTVRQVQLMMREGHVDLSFRHVRQVSPL